MQLEKMCGIESDLAVLVLLVLSQISSFSTVLFGQFGDIAVEGDTRLCNCTRRQYRSSNLSSRIDQTSQYG